MDFIEETSTLTRAHIMWYPGFCNIYQIFIKIKNNKFMSLAGQLYLDEGKYFVATSDGRDICNLQIGQAINSYNFDGEDDLYGFNSTLNKITTIPHSNTIKEAWLKTEVAIKSYHVVNRNNSKFSDEKIMKKILKDE